MFKTICVHDCAAIGSANSYVTVLINSVLTSTFE